MDPVELWPAIEQCPASVVVTDRNAKIRWVNRCFTATTGYLPEECLGKNPRLLKSGHHPRAFYEELWGTILEGLVWRGELCNRRKDGERYWESATIAPYTDSHGEPAGFVAVKREVGRLKQVETRFAKLLGAMREGYLELVEGVITRANPAAARGLGLEPSEVVGASLAVEEAADGLRMTRSDGSLRLVQGRFLSKGPEVALLFEPGG